MIGLYVVWLGLGAAMAAALYEPAFSIVGRRFDVDADRVRAVAAVTLLGGLASTCFVPLTTLLEGRFGWTGASWGLAVVVALSTVAVGQWALPSLRENDPAEGGVDWTADEDEPLRLEAWVPGAPLVVVYGFTSVAATALVTSLVPALVERGYTPAGAAWIAGLIGVMQLPGRTLIFSGRLAGHPALLLTGSLALQGGGLAIVAAARSPFIVALGVTAFALGAGVNTLIRPQLVQVMYGVHHAGYINGILARTKNLARAGGPLVAATLHHAGGYGLVFGGSAVALSTLAWHWWLVRVRSL